MRIILLITLLFISQLACGQGLFRSSKSIHTKNKHGTNGTEHLHATETDYYPIARRVLLSERNAILRRLTGNKIEQQFAILELEQRLEVEIPDAGTAICLIEDQTQRLRQILPVIAYQRSNVNLELASDLYLKALEQFKKGNIREVISILNGTQLDSSFQKVLQIQDKGLSKDSGLRAKELHIFDEVISCYELTAEAYLLNFQFRQAVEVYTKIQHIASNPSVYKKLKRAYLTGALSAAYYGLNQKQKAFKAQELSLHYAYYFLGPNHPQTVICRSQLALLKKDMGDFQGALAEQKMVIDIQEKNPTPGHPKILSSYQNLAIIYYSHGRYLKALDAQNKAISTLAQSLKPDSLEVAFAYSHLASLYQRLTEYPRALKAQLKAIAIQEQLMVPNHPHIADSYQLLASVYHDWGDHQKALEAQKMAIHIRKQLFISQSPTISASYYKLAEIYKDKGQFSDALRAYSKAIAIQTSMIESGDSALAPSHQLLADIYFNWGKYGKALEAQIQVLQIQKRTLSPTHTSFINTYQNLMNIYQRIGDRANVFDYQDKVIALNAEALVADPLWVEESFKVLASIYPIQGKYVLAEEAQLQVIYFQEQVFPIRWQSVATSYHQLAKIRLQMKEYGSALQSQKVALSIQKKKLSPFHPDLTTSYHQLASIYYQNNQLDSAIWCEDRAYDIWESMLPYSYPTLRVARENLSFLHEKRGIMHQRNRKYEMAIGHFQQALPLNPDSAGIYNRMGLCYYHRKDFSSAIQCYEKSREIDPKKELIYLNNSGIAYAKLGKFKQAKTRLEKLQQLNPPNGLAHRNWAIYYALRRNTDAALTQLEKAVESGYHFRDRILAEEAFMPLREEKRFKMLVERLASQLGD
ncbi:MAG: tetratricopeptide repeat protein [Bacteroidota bacterium]